MNKYPISSKTPTCKTNRIARQENRKKTTITPLPSTKAKLWEAWIFILSLSVRVKNKLSISNNKRTLSWFKKINWKIGKESTSNLLWDLGCLISSVSWVTAFSVINKMRILRAHPVRPSSTMEMVTWLFSPWIRTNRNLKQTTIFTKSLNSMLR